MTDLVDRSDVVAVASDQTPADPTPVTAASPTGWRRSIPMVFALLLVAGVWIAGCIWSFEEQTAFAEFKHFHLPWLLPLVIDGLAIAMAAVAFAASLDARPAVFARLGIAAAVVLSAGSNAAWAWERSNADTGTVALAAVVPVLANLAFEVLLSEVRRQVMRRRGIPAPVKIPLPRLSQMILAPWSTFWEWRRLVLKVTALTAAFDAAVAASRAAPDSGRQTPVRSPARPRKQTPAKAAPRTPAKRTPVKQTPVDRTPSQQTPVDQASAETPDPSVGQTPRDTEDLARLRTEYPHRTPSINEVQRLLGGGRARAIRLRDLAAQTPAGQVNGHRPEFVTAGT